MLRRLSIASVERQREQELVQVQLCDFLLQFASDQLHRADSVALDGCGMEPKKVVLRRSLPVVGFSVRQLTPTQLLVSRTSDGFLCESGKGLSEAPKFG